MHEFGYHFSGALRSHFADMNHLIHRLINKGGRHSEL
jgi:hypothetical protein